MLRSQKDDAAVGGTDFLKRSLLIESSDEEFDAMIRREHERACLRVAAQQIKDEFKPTSREAFWLTTLQDVSVPDAAQQIGISVGSVYAARSRIMRRLQQQAKANEEES